MSKFVNACDALKESLFKRHFMMLNNAQKVADLGAKETLYGLIFPADIFTLFLEAADERL
jgi:hypothetical protein